MDSLRCTDLLHARAQKLQLPGEVQSHSGRNHGIPEFGYRIRFFRSFSDYSKAALALLACQPKSLIQ